MVSPKNYTTGQLSFVAALLISAVVGACFALFQIVWQQAIVAVVCVFAFGFFIIREALRRFIFRRLKLIFKFIYQTKASKREEFFYNNILPQKTIEEVEEDVQKWADKNKKEIEQLRAMEQYRKEFLQNFSHEIKTPIFSIQGYIGTLLSGAMDDKEVAINFLTNAAKNVERMVNLINDIDEISRIESGDQPMKITNFVVQDLIKEVFESLSMAMAAKSIAPSIKKGCETPVTVFADRERLRQVFINLVVNAINYGNQNGHVIASIYKTGDDMALIEISDDGIGIAEEHLPRIFERFYRTDVGRSRNNGGTGLGLAICKHIIEAHRQTIHIRSKPLVGTTVGFTLRTKAGIS